MKIPESCSVCGYSGEDADEGVTWAVCGHPAQKGIYGLYGRALAPKYIRGTPPKWCPLREEKEEGNENDG